MEKVGNWVVWKGSMRSQSMDPRGSFFTRDDMQGGSLRRPCPRRQAPTMKPGRCMHYKRRFPAEAEFVSRLPWGSQSSPKSFRIKQKGLVVCVVEQSRCLRLSARSRNQGHDHVNFDTLLAMLIFLLQSIKGHTHRDQNSRPLSHIDCRET